MFRNTYITPYTSNHWNSIPPLSIVQPAEELGLIDGIDQVEAYIQRNYGDQARLQLYCWCWDNFFLFADSLIKEEYQYLMEKLLLTLKKMIFTMKWLFFNSILSSVKNSG